MTCVPPPHHWNSSCWGWSSWRIWVYLQKLKEVTLLSKTKTEYFSSFSFSCFAPQLWNFLPSGLWNMISLPQLAKNLKTHLFIQAYCNDPTGTLVWPHCYLRCFTEELSVLRPPHDPDSLREEDTGRETKSPFLHQCPCN